MIKYLLKTTEEYRMETIEDVKHFHELLREDAAQQQYHIAAFSWTEKQIKSKGEVIEEYFVVKVQKQFQDHKEAIIPLDEITYTTFDINKETSEDY